MSEGLTYANGEPSSFEISADLDAQDFHTSGRRRSVDNADAAMSMERPSNAAADYVWRNSD